MKISLNLIIVIFFIKYCRQYWLDYWLAGLVVTGGGCTGGLSSSLSQMTAGRAMQYTASPHHIAG